MELVATIIANPARPVLDAALLARAQALFDGASAPRLLADGIAAEIAFSGAAAELKAQAARLRAALAAPVDVAVQPAAGRKKKLFLADMDSTMIAQECIDELADFAGLKAHVAAITERAMRGEIAFEPALRERVALLKGLSADIVETIIRERITLTPGGRELVSTMRANGALTCLVSGGFTRFTDRIAAMIGFDRTRANRLIVDSEGKLAGLVEEPIFSRDGKLATLRVLRDELRLSPGDTMAVGDGANDLDMIGEAGIGVAFHAKPAVAAAAAVQIDHGDLTALLYLQGYAREEFAAVS